MRQNEDIFRYLFYLSQMIQEMKIYRIHIKKDNIQLPYKLIIIQEAMNTNRLLIDVHKMRAAATLKRSVRIKFVFDQGHFVATEYANYNNGLYPYMQKLFIVKDFHYVQIVVESQEGDIMANKKVLQSQFKDSQMISIKNEDEIKLQIVYHLEMKEMLTPIKETGKSKVLQRRVSLIQTQQTNENSINRFFANLKNINLLYQFPQRLDPIIFIYNHLINIILWNKAHETIVVGLLLSLIIYFFTKIILIGSVGLLVFRGRIYKMMSQVERRSKKINERLIIPERNIQFLQEGMKHYVAFYQYVRGVFFNEDKSKLIMMVQICCINAFLLALFISFFGLQIFLIINIWLGLSLTSPYKNAFINLLQPIFSGILQYQFKIFDKITSKYNKVIQKDVQYQAKTQFYYYHYERWWIIKLWADQDKKYSDDEYKCLLEVRENAPRGWRWIEEWKIDKSGNVDDEGYEYSNDMMKEFIPKFPLANLRRRKWKRSCIKLKKTKETSIY